MDRSHTFTGLALERSIQDGARPLGLRGRRPRGLGPRCHDIFSIECIGGVLKKLSHRVWAAWQDGLLPPDRNMATNNNSHSLPSGCTNPPTLINPTPRRPQTEK